MTDLGPIKAALADLDEAHLEALIGASNHVPQIIPGLLAWLTAAADWGLNRRHGFEHELRPPESAIPEDEDLLINQVATASRARFERGSSAVRAFFDELAVLLTGEGRKQ